MKRYAIAFFLFAFITSMVILAHSSSANIQGKTKRTISKIQFYSEWITPPVEYSALKVKGKKTEFSSMFERGDRKSTRLNSSHGGISRMPSSA